MRFPPATVLFAALYVLPPIPLAEAVQACLSQEGSWPSKGEKQHSEIAAVSDSCKSLADGEETSEEPEAKDSQTIKTTVLIMLLRAYAEASGGMH